MSETTAKSVSMDELAGLFLRLSLTAFGGPVAHIAMGEDEIVTRRKWLTREHYLDLIAATNLIPGPNSTEVMIHVGYTLRGIPGAAEALGVSISTVKRWVDEGLLKAHRTAGGHRKLLRADVLAFARSAQLPEARVADLELTPATREPRQASAALYRALVSGDGDRVRSLIGGLHNGGMRLETLPDATLPGQGAGFGGGNFVITQIKAWIKPPAGAPPTGRFVRIELPGKQKILSLAEVQVFSGAENIASGKAASQSTTARRSSSWGRAESTAAASASQIAP